MIAPAPPVNWLSAQSQYPQSLFTRSRNAAATAKVTNDQNAAKPRRPRLSVGSQVIVSVVEKMKEDAMGVE